MYTYTYTYKIFVLDTETRTLQNVSLFDTPPSWWPLVLCRGPAFTVPTPPWPGCQVKPLWGLC